MAWHELALLHRQLVEAMTGQRGQGQPQGRGRQSPRGRNRQRCHAGQTSVGCAPSMRAGTPNWGGLLKKVRAAAGSPQEANFDVLYVVDPARNWYGGAHHASACVPPAPAPFWGPVHFLS